MRGLACYERVERLALAREVLVERCAPYPDRVCKVAHAHGPVSALAQEVERSVEDPLARVGMSSVCHCAPN